MDAGPLWAVLTLVPLLAKHVPWYMYIPLFYVWLKSQGFLDDTVVKESTQWYILITAVLSFFVFPGNVYMRNYMIFTILVPFLVIFFIIFAFAGGFSYKNSSVTV